MPKHPKLRPGDVVRYSDSSWVVHHYEAPNRVVALNACTNEVRSISTSALKPIREHEGPNPLRPRDLLSEEEWNEAVRKFQIIRPIVDQGFISTRAEVEALAKKAKLSPATIYNTINRFKRWGTVSSLVRKKRTDANKTRISERMEKLIQKAIKEEYLSKQRKSPKAAFQVLLLWCHQQKLKPPSLMTFRNRISKISKEQQITLREGRYKALRVRPIRGKLTSDAPYGVLQIDHTKLNVMVVDEHHRLAIGRPWITVAIDVHTRMIAGYYISLESPGDLSTGICISNAILPKEAYLMRHSMDYEWPCIGKPKIIHVDNAKEFHGNMLKACCEEYGIDLRFRPVRKPHYGGHIERLNGTLKRALEQIPGTTFQNPQHRGDYDSEGNAMLSLLELERWIGFEILGSYHHQPHSQLQMAAPINYWRSAILGNGAQLATGIAQLSVSEERVRTDFLPGLERTIQREGVVIDGICYRDSVLDIWMGAHDPENNKKVRKFLFKRDPRDISKIFFRDPNLEQYLPISYADRTRPPISLWEWRAINRELKTKNLANIDEGIVFRALAAKRQIENDASLKKRSARLGRERRLQNRRAVGTETHPKSAEPVFDNLSDEDIQPFDEIIL